MESKELTVGESNSSIVPIGLQKQAADNQIELATHWAKRLMEVVRSCGMSKRVAGKEYLQVEAWLVIAEFAHCRAVPEEAKPWVNADGELVGYTCRAVVKDAQGIEVGSGESSCGFDAFPCRGRRGSEQDKAAKGAAQTWAISRALSNRFRYVALMAGFSPTPAEEMGPPDREHTVEPTPSAAPHGSCPKHNQPWQISSKTGRKGHLNPTCTLGVVLFEEFAKTADAAGADTETYLANHVGPWDKAHEAKWFAAVEWAKDQLNKKMDQDQLPI